MEELKSKLRGDLILPGEPAYDDARSIWNGMIDRRPRAIARCLGVADVVEGVAFAREKGLDLCIKSGGHNISGLAVADDALVLDMSRMRGVFVDPEARVAHAQGGCVLGDVDRETQLYGLAAVLGFVSNTGIAGLTLGGGFGYLSRQHGWTSDTVRSITVVTADGRIVRASDKQHADLFWGLRGGGGNFGVAVDFEYQVYPVGPEIVAGAVAWPIEQADEVLGLFQSLIVNAPPEMSCVLAARIAPPAPWIAEESHGKPVVMIFVCHTGALEEGEASVAPIKGLGNPVGDVLQRRPYITQQNLIDATQPNGRRYYWKSEYLPAVEPAFLSRVVEGAVAAPSPHSAILVFPFDGGVNRLPQDHSAVGNRDARFVVNIAGSWDEAADDESNIEWARATWQGIRPFSTGGTYINFLTEEEGVDRIADAYGANGERLVEIKTKWDPENLFRMNKNIPPRAP
jgi:FAD/FMN-containing dehydrogenase